MEKLGGKPSFDCFILATFHKYLPVPVEQARLVVVPLCTETDSPYWLAQCLQNTVASDSEGKHLCVLH